MYFTSAYTCIFYKFSKESQAVNRFLDVRGWGHLTGKGNGGLGLSEEEATVIQDARRDAVVDFLNHRDELIWMAEEYIKLKSK